MIKTRMIEFSFHKFRDILGPFSQLSISLKWHFLKLTYFFGLIFHSQLFQQDLNLLILRLLVKLRQKIRLRKSSLCSSALIYLQTFLSQVFCATKLIGGFPYLDNSKTSVLSLIQLLGICLFNIFRGSRDPSGATQSPECTFNEYVNLNTISVSKCSQKYCKTFFHISHQY